MDTEYSSSNTNIIIPDIDKIIVDMVNLTSLANLILVNNFFHNLISTKPVMSQWKFTKSAEFKSYISAYYYSCNYHVSILIGLCHYGFLEYAKYFVSKHSINFNTDNGFNTDIGFYHVFINSCTGGYIDMVKWLIGPNETNGYTKIDIDDHIQYVFYSCCVYGQIDIAKWLIELGETGRCSKIDIHERDIFTNCPDHIFFRSCQYGQLHIVKWLIELGESAGYSKINIHANNDYIFKNCKYPEIIQWLTELDKNGYSDHQ